VTRLRAEGVSVRLGAVRALDDVRLALDGGRVTMLVGPNGAGKSTLIKVLLGLVRPDAGRFEVDGSRLAIDRAWKARIGYLPEAVAFSENLSGRQVLRFFARARGVPAARADEVLERIGLAGAGRRAIRGYSRGMRQRLGLGVAIVSEPELLVLDEPTSGLDQQGLGVLWSLLDEWRARGRMVLVSSHDLAMMERRIDAVCVLRGGRVLAQGSPDALRRDAKLPHRVRLDVSGAPAERVGALCDALATWGRGRIERGEDVVDVEVAAADLLELLAIQGRFAGVVGGLRVEEPTLDLVYASLVGAGPEGAGARTGAA